MGNGAKRKCIRCLKGQEECIINDYWECSWCDYDKPSLVKNKRPLDELQEALDEWKASPPTQPMPQPGRLIKATPVKTRLPLPPPPAWPLFLDPDDDLIDEDPDQ